MANVLEKQILEDGYRNAIVKLTGILTSSDASEIPAISLTEFVNNDPVFGKLWGLRLDHVWHSIGDGIEVQISWAANTPQTIMAIAGRGKESFHTVGGLIPDKMRSGYSGNINLTTTGFGIQGNGQQNFTVELEFTKLYS